MREHKNMELQDRIVPLTQRKKEKKTAHPPSQDA